MGAFSILHWLILATSLWVLLMIPISEIIRKAGFSRWWTLVHLLPVINLLALFVFAFARWPAADPTRPIRARRDEATVTTPPDEL